MGFSPFCGGFKGVVAESAGIGHEVVRDADLSGDRGGMFAGSILLMEI